MIARAEDKAAAPAAAPPAAAADQAATPQGAAATIAESGTATVVAVDADTRVVVLKTADGNTIPVKCGKDVVNFDQIKAGDEVKATEADRVVVFISKEGATVPQADGRVVLRNAKGERPGIVIADTRQATAKVDAVDAAAKTVTLTGATGKPMTFSVGPDLDLSGVKPGDQVTVRATCGIAISVQRPGEEGEARPAAEKIGTQTRTATVESVDREQRTVTLKTSEGKTRTIHVGDEAVNFDQVQPGDQVRATLAESVALSIQKAGAGEQAAPAAAAGTEDKRDSVNIITAPKGSKPGILIAATKRMSGKIDSIDADQRIVTLTPADGGKPQKVKASPSIDLSTLKAGDAVEARVTDAIALVVEKPEKK
jgi:Cu/Ag efflux protein CusF